MSILHLIKQEAVAFIEMSGAWGPFLFILLHLIRPFLFIPVIFICLIGGLLFGHFMGAVFSLIGLTLSCVVFYAMGRIFPTYVEKILSLKQRIFGSYYQLSNSQVALLKIIPFIHFHLLSFCIYEISSDFKNYTKSSFITNIPFVLIYSTFGNWFTYLTHIQIAIIIVLFIPLFHLLRTKQWMISWNDFFKMRA